MIEILQDNIRIVLVNPSHPGNVGAVARAMKNMGLKQLYLVSPEDFPNEYAFARASGADDVLADAVVVESVEKAIAPCQWIFGTSARSRMLAWPVKNPRECAQFITKNLPAKVAILFGRESRGLTNEELACCHYHIHIPTDEKFSSLNLAAAVQVLTYELRMAALESINKVTGESNIEREDPLANAMQMDGFYSHLQKVMMDLDFLDPKQPKLLMRRLQRLFNRAHLDEVEVNILRGLLSSIERKLI